MRNIELYLGDEQVEINSEIYYNYELNDLTNPTIVKNSFTKTVTISGTPHNNKILGQYWNIERTEGSGGIGVSFNASRKVDFTILSNGSILQSGYMKLDAVKKVNGMYTYEVTLYGGLGDYFYQLSYNDDGEKKQLKDLEYGYDLTFTANMNTVKTAWDSLTATGDSKWKVLNFMPAYNGYPDDFDANKVIMNLSGTSLSQREVTEDGKFEAKSGWTIGELPEDYTEWEIRDLRSYLQRPCIRMKSIISACCDSTQNGGYTVNLDSNFFNTGNPYYEKTWLSLPMIPNLEYSSTEQIIESGLIGSTTSGSNDNLMMQSLSFSSGTFPSEAPKKINVYGYVSVPSTATRTGNTYTIFIDGRKIQYLGSLFVQCIALNGSSIVGASETYNLTSYDNGRYGSSSVYGTATYNEETGQIECSGGHNYVPFLNTRITDSFGYFAGEGDSYRWKDLRGRDKNFSFTLDNVNSQITELRMVYFWGSNQMKQTLAVNKVWTATQGECNIGNVEYYNITLDDIRTDMQAVIGDSLGRTGTKITKDLLLSTESTPSDYLLSYCKMFGLYFIKDLYSKKIDILTRKAFYNRNYSAATNLNDIIDRSKDINITPLTYDTQWYQFVQEMDESDYVKKYKTAKGVDYGCKILNTGYEFNSEKNNLLEDNCIKSGIEGMEKSNKFIAYVNDLTCRGWMTQTKYKLWRLDDEELEIYGNPTDTGTLYPINENTGLKYYDIFPKLQFHNNENKAIDGNNCLVFFSGMKYPQSGRSVNLNYILSDDTAQQKTMNDGTPCWLYTPNEYCGSTRLCYILSAIPVFERYYTNNNSSKVINSLDFGTAQELYVPTYNITDDSNIYYNYWKTYLSDLYNVNTKILSCYVKIDDNIDFDWFRKFYWFDNAIWSLNKIVDWNICSSDTTKMEFVKVQDINDYDSASSGGGHSIVLTASTYEVEATGATVQLGVTVDDGTSWRIYCENYSSAITFSQTGGTGNTSFTCTIPTFTGEDFRMYTITAVRNEDAINNTINIMQRSSAFTDFYITPGDIVAPASGGTYIWQAHWTNKGDDYIAECDYNEGDEYLHITYDRFTYSAQNQVIVTISATTATTLRGNYFQIKSNNGLQDEVRIDQLPVTINYESEGGSSAVTFFSISGATVTSVPYWAEVSSTGQVYTVRAQANTDISGRTGEVVFTKGDSSASLVIQQDVSDAFSVSPTALTFDSTGGTLDFVVTNTDNDVWKITTYPNWAIPSQLASSASSVTVSVYVNSANTGSTEKVGDIVVRNQTKSMTKRVTITQRGETSYITLSPTTVSFDSTGGTATLNVSSNISWSADTTN